MVIGVDWQLLANPMHACLIASLAIGSPAGHGGVVEGKPKVIVVVQGTASQGLTPRRLIEAEVITVSSNLHDPPLLQGTTLVHSTPHAVRHSRSSVPPTSSKITMVLEKDPLPTHPVPKIDGLSRVELLPRLEKAQALNVRQDSAQVRSEEETNPRLLPVASTRPRQRGIPFEGGAIRLPPCLRGDVTIENEVGHIGGSGTLHADRPALHLDALTSYLLVELQLMDNPSCLRVVIIGNDHCRTVRWTGVLPLPHKVVTKTHAQVRRHPRWLPIFENIVAPFPIPPTLHLDVLATVPALQAEASCVGLRCADGPHLLRSLEDSHTPYDHGEVAKVHAEKGLSRSASQSAGVWQGVCTLRNPVGLIIPIEGVHFPVCGQHGRA
mmetsp:Transcript_71416/g.180245  ORF Transcript_71416/g.180245 Transcript_71416/m.180245 type:complete len:381 (-) Transcript_71416:957-2099(-)